MEDQTSVTKTYEVAVAFENLNVGDTFTVTMDDHRIISLVCAGYLKEVAADDGQGGVEQGESLGAVPAPRSDLSGQSEPADNSGSKAARTRGHRPDAGVTGV